jgi:hypothetical protein
MILIMGSGVGCNWPVATYPCFFPPFPMPLPLGFADSIHPLNPHPYHREG